MIDPLLTDDDHEVRVIDPDAIPDIAELRIILKQIAAQPETNQQETPCNPDKENMKPDNID